MVRFGRITRVAETQGKYTEQTELLLNSTQEHQTRTDIGTQFPTLEFEQNTVVVHG